MSVYKTYPGYESALPDCVGGAYQNPNLVEVVFRKTLACIENMKIGQYSLDATSAFTAIALLQVTQGLDTVRVLDVGGACGLHYFAARMMLPKNIRLRWCVIETPAMAARAKILQNEELSFFDSTRAVQKQNSGFDLVFSSGTLQCVSTPYQLLETLIEIGAPYMMLARAGFTLGARDVTVVHRSMLSENGPGPMPAGIQDAEMKYPFTFLSIETFLSALKGRYQILLQFQDSSGAFPVNNEPIFGTGLLLSRTH